tara:strand:- start:167 stop:916 length:750 start_codon:yes stop_codon:yes gene_type:complete
MKKTFLQVIAILILTLAVCCVGNAQVGIGTTTPDPNTMLHIVPQTGTYYPIRAEGLPYEPSFSQYLVKDDDGNFGWTDAPEAGDGLIDAIMNISEWRGNPYVINLPSGFYEETNIDLELTSTVVIAPNQLAILDIRYNLPGGVTAYTADCNTDIGAFIEKDGVRLPYTASSFNVRTLNDHNAVRMDYPEWIFNNTSSPITVVYSLRGYVRQHSSFGANTINLRRKDSDEDLNNNWGFMFMHIKILRINI